MRSKLRILSVCLAALLVVALYPSFAKVEIVFWDPYGPPWDKLLEEGTANIQAKHPEFTIKHEHVPWSGLIQKLTVAVASGTAPDAAHLWGTWWAVNLGVQGVVMPLDEQIAKDKELSLDDIYPGYLETFRYDGKIWGFPDSAQPTSWMWNKDVFSEVGLDPNKPPASWGDVVAFSDKITKKDSAGNLIRIGFIPNNMWGGFYNFASHWGGTFYDEKTGKIKAYNETNLKALQWQIDFTNRYGGQEVINALQSGFGAGADEAMVSGRLAMQLATHYHYYFRHVAKPDLNYGFAPPVLPGPIPGDEAKGGMVCANAHVVFASTKHHWEAYLTVRDYMTEGIKAWIKLSAHASVNRKVNQRALAENWIAEYYPRELWRQDMQVLEYNRPLAPIPNFSKLMDELNAQTDLARLGKKTASQALQYVDEVVNKDLEKVLRRR
ncbi:MAG: extracellular solute-binding protein [bacterium]